MEKVRTMLVALVGAVALAACANLTPQRILIPCGELDRDQDGFIGIPDFTDAAKVIPEGPELDEWIHSFYHQYGNTC